MQPIIHWMIDMIRNWNSPCCRFKYVNAICHHKNNKIIESYLSICEIQGLVSDWSGWGIQRLKNKLPPSLNFYIQHLRQRFSFSYFFHPQMSAAVLIQHFFFVHSLKFFQIEWKIFSRPKKKLMLTLIHARIVEEREIGMWCRMNSIYHWEEEKNLY